MLSAGTERLDTRRKHAALSLARKVQLALAHPASCNPIIPREHEVVTKQVDATLGDDRHPKRHDVPF